MRLCLELNRELEKNMYINARKEGRRKVAWCFRRRRERIGRVKVRQNKKSHRGDSLPFFSFILLSFKKRQSLSVSLLIRFQPGLFNRWLMVSSSIFLLHNLPGG